jgi:hypothetical protein
MILMVVFMLVSALALAVPASADPWGGNLCAYFTWRGDGWWITLWTTCLPPGPENFDYSDAVQGRFVDNTELLAEPAAGSGIGKVMEVGKTAWVHGVDPTGSFFLINIGGATAWVPVSSMSPNFDAPWNGAPLVVPVVD